MGRRGPKPTPAALNALRGNPGHRPDNPEEPKPSLPTSLTAPGWLKAEGRAIWEELTPELLRLGLLTQIDVSVLAAACRWWAIYRRADRALNAGLIVETKANGKQPRPEFAIA